MCRGKNDQVIFNRSRTWKMKWCLAPECQILSFLNASKTKANKAMKHIFSVIHAKSPQGKKHTWFNPPKLRFMFCEQPNEKKTTRWRLCDWQEEEKKTSDLAETQKKEMMDEKYPGGGTKRCRDVFIAATLLNCYDKLMANILTDLSTHIHYLFIIKNSIWQTVCHYSDGLGESGTFE